MKFPVRMRKKTRYWGGLDWAEKPEEKSTKKRRKNILWVNVGRALKRKGTSKSK